MTLLAEKVRDGCRRSLAKLITLIENEAAQAADILAELHPATGRARVIGITGPPGAGKSTLTGKLARAYRGRGETVGIVAVDPTSPFSGGALLGDRLRMQDLATDSGVFMRSMSTRGSLGGLSLTTGDAVKAIDASGKDVILVETVGVGQAEVEIMEIADTVVVVTVPGLGDDIQINKAGIMEIGDIFVVNKADRDGADQVTVALEMMLDLNPVDTGWRPPVLRTVATRELGIEELHAAIARHAAWAAGGEFARRREKRTAREIFRLAESRLRQRLRRAADEAGYLATLAREVEQKTLSPYRAAENLLQAGDARVCVKTEKEEKA